MKKRVLSLLIVLVLAIALFANGCGIFTINETRDLARNVSTITYGGKTAHVTKGELMEYFVTYADTYMNYYGMTAEEVLEFSMHQLNTRQLLVLYAEVELEITPTAEGLGQEAYNKAISAANDSYNEIWESYIESIKADRASASPSESASASPSASATARPTYTPVTDDDDDAGEIEWATDNDGYVIPFYDITDLIASDDEYRSVKRTALKQVWDVLEKNNKPKTYFVDKELESAVIEALLEAVHGSSTITDEQVADEFNRLIAEQKAHITTDADYKSHLESGEDVFFVKENEDGTYGGYGYVKNLLISFDSDAIANGDEIDALVEEYNRMNSSKVYAPEVLQAKLAEIASALEIKNYGTAGYYNEDGFARDLEGSEDTTANTVSKVIGDVVYEDGGFKFNGNNDNTFYTEILAEIGTTVPAITDGDAAKERINKFVNYIFGYGEDTGMFNNEIDYLVAPENNSWYEDFTKVSQQLIKSCEQDGASAVDIGWSITPYGVHVVMVTYVPMLHDADGDKYYTLDTVVNTITGKTIEDVIRDKLEDAKNSSTEITFQKEIINEYKDDFVIHTDVYNSIING